MKFKLIRRVLQFYYHGFKEMTYGKSLWVIILIKLFIIFFIFKLFFFRNFLDSKFDSDQDRSNYVVEQLTK